jgi:capping protein beta
VKSGSWDSIHIVEVNEASNSKSATYKLTTTVMLNMHVDKQEVGETNWSGTLTRQVSHCTPFSFFFCDSSINILFCYNRLS